MAKKEVHAKKTKREQRIISEVRQKTAGYIVAGFGVVAGLAWNDAIKTLIESVFPESEDTIVAKFLYALAITVLVAVVSLYVVRFIGKKDAT